MSETLNRKRQRVYEQLICKGIWMITYEQTRANLHNDDCNDSVLEIV